MIKSSKAKARKKRAEQKVLDVVRPKVDDRDGYCRLFGAGEVVYQMAGSCEGPSELAHFGDFQRWKTRGMAPEGRHSTEGTFKMCHRHHNDYDKHRMMIEPLTNQWCDGPLRFSMGGKVYEEPAR